MNPFTQCVIGVIENIPKGEVMSYGEIASLCGSSRAARQVVRVLHIYSESLGLPWHRVVRKDLMLPEAAFREEQKTRLEAEGIKFHEFQIIR
jgi:methylated-DNA-protein-cysteine methyltransferase-like protein